MATIWSLWLSRNEHTFRNRRPSPMELIARIKQLSLDLEEAMTKVPTKRISKHWRKAKKGWIKLNSDASFDSVEYTCKLGGLLRDEEGNWKGGYWSRTTAGCVTEAELRAIAEGLEFAWKMRPQRIEVETDSLEAYRLINGEVPTPSELLERVRKCRELLRLPWTSKLNWINRQGNAAADFMAKLDFAEEGQEWMVDSQPPGMAPFLLADIS